MSTIQTSNAYEQVHNTIRPIDVIVTRKQKGFSVYNQDMVSPHLVITYCHQGFARFLYDMHEVTYSKNEVAVVLPGHVLNQLECSDDFTFSRLVVSKELFNEIQSRMFGKDDDAFTYRPIITLTEERAELLMQIFSILADIASFESQDLGMRHHLLLAQLFVGTEFLHYHYREQKHKKAHQPRTELFNHFCNLVIENYLKSREVQFYAKKMHYTPKHFTKLIREEMGITPAEWIEQYVITRAKILIEANPTLPLTKIAYMLNFAEPTNFYRYFKRVTGITASEYRNSLTRAS